MEICLNIIWPNIIMSEINQKTKNFKVLNFLGFLTSLVIYRLRWSTKNQFSMNNLARFLSTVSFLCMSDSSSKNKYLFIIGDTINEQSTTFSFDVIHESHGVTLYWYIQFGMQISSTLKFIKHNISSSCSFWGLWEKERLHDRTQLWDLLWFWLSTRDKHLLSKFWPSEVL